MLDPIASRHCGLKNAIEVTDISILSSYNFYLIINGTMMPKSKIALFIDAENLTHWIKNSGPEDLLADLSTSGQVITRRAYGVWSQPNMTSMQSSLNQMGFELLHSYHPVSGKNSTDILMTVDIMEHALRLKDVEWFVLATGDSDFSPLFRKLREMGKEVIGVGPKSPLSECVKTSCSRYIYTDISTKTSNLLDYDEAANLAERIIESESDPIPLGQLKSTLVNTNSAFNEKSLGFNSFRIFIDSIDSIKAYCGSDKTTWYAVPAPVKKNSNTVKQKATVEKYTSLLRNLKWRLVSRDTIFQINSRLKKADDMEKNEIIEFLLNALAADRPEITATEIRKTLAIFIKAEILVSVDTQSGSLDAKLKYIAKNGFIKVIDKALLSRLISGCNTHGITFESNVAKEFLYSEYESHKHIKEICDELSC